MDRLGVQTELSSAPLPEENVEDHKANVDPYRVLGFGYIAMRETWVAVMIFYAIALVFLLAGGLMYIYFGTYTGLYKLHFTAWITISNLKQTEQVCI